MAYIGRQLARGENKLFDDISSSFNGSTTVFNLTVSSVATATATAYQLFVSLGGVMQKPNTDFTTAGNQITFTTAPAAGLSCWIMMQGDTIDQAAIPDASVSPSKIAGSGDFAFPADVRLKDGDGSHYVGFQAPTTVSTNKIWTLPAADGSANQYLKTDGSGTLSWGSDSATDSTKMPLAGGTFDGDVIFTGASYSAVWDKSDNALEFADNAKATFGNGDLSIFHDGTYNHIDAVNNHPIIANAGTSDFYIKGGNVYFMDEGASEYYLKAIQNGAVELFHNNVKTFETFANGVVVYGPEGGTGDIYLYADEGDDNADRWRIEADTSGNLAIGNKSTGSWVNGLTFDGSNNATFASATYGPAKAVGALDLDLSTGNYFTKTISGNSTFTFSNPAASGTVSIFMLELTHSSGTVTWPGTVKWNADTAPTLTAGKTHLFMFVTDDNGSRYRGSALVDYVN